MQTNNTTALEAATNDTANKRLTSMDTKLHLLHFCMAQKKFHNYWQLEPINLGYYVTKHHTFINH